MLESIDSAELSLWYAFESIEPQGQQRADLQTAQILAAIKNMIKGPQDKPTHPCDLIPDFWREKDRARKGRGGIEKDLEAVKRWSQSEPARPGRGGGGKQKTLKGGG